MSLRRILMREAKMDCLLNCRHYTKCQHKMGTECKHLGGRKIPVFKPKTA